MKAFWNILRDPAITSLIGLTTVIVMFIGYQHTISTYYASQSDNELSIIYAKTDKPSTPMMPKDKIKLIINEKETPKELDSIETHIFYLANNSKIPIKASNFISPLTISNKTNDNSISIVDTCHDDFFNSCSTETSLRFAPISWSKQKTIWKGKIDLLNPGELACISITTDLNAKENNAKIINRYVWNARIENINIKFYSSTKDYNTRKKPEKTNKYPYITSILIDLDVFWFFILFVSMFLSIYYLSYKRKWLSNQKPLLISLKTTTIALLSISSADILITHFSKEAEQYFGKLTVPYYMWVFVVMHILLVVYIIFTTRRIPN